jgi:hypothetical protein
MGYTTRFDGSFAVTPTLKPEHAAYLREFAETRRMQRDPAKAAALADPARLAVGLPVGPEGAYFVGGGGMFGQDSDASVVNQNRPPEGQPGLWCQWVPNEAGTAIEWDGGEKFYDYVEWLRYLLKHFLKPAGYVLDGAVAWVGEDDDDRGRIVVESNKVRVQRAVTEYEDTDDEGEDDADEA